MPLLRSIQVGVPRQITSPETDDAARIGSSCYLTGFYKEPVAGPVRVGPFNLVGDGQADTVHHGGPDKAVCVYSGDHYAYWREVLNQTELACGAFGENFTVADLTEQAVCIGDVWQIGDATFQVSQPRQPCWKLAQRWRVKTLVLQVQQTGRTGWYFRVLVEGTVAAGMPLTLVQRPHPEWTVERANSVMHHGQHAIDRQATAELARLPLLSASWRETLAERVT